MHKKTLFTAHPVNDRDKKNLLFLNLIKSRKSTSRTEISKLTKTSAVTVSNYMNTYLKKGLVLETGYEASSGGRRPELVELNKKSGYAAGIDITPGRISAILANFGMEKLAGASVPGDTKKDLKNSITRILKQLLENLKMDKNVVKKTGITATSGDIAENIQNYKDEIEKELEIPVLFGHPALCAAFGEKSANPETDEASKILFIYTTLGEGVFIADNEFYEANNKKNEYAYLMPWGRKFDIAEEARAIVGRGVGTKMVDIAQGNMKNITAETVVSAARESDEIAADLLRTAAINLSVRVAYLVNLFEPEIVIIGGGAEKARDLFFDPIASNVKKLSSHGVSGRTKVLPAVLGENARTKGAAYLAIREIFIET